MPDYFTAHGIQFERTGSCTNCGGCDSDCSNCPHGKLTDGKWLCEIYETRGEVCKYCTENKDSSWYRDGKEVTHQVCIDFPNHPWLNVVRKGVCTYQFRRVDNKSMDTLPFVKSTFIDEDPYPKETDGIRSR